MDSFLKCFHSLLWEREELRAATEAKEAAVSQSIDSQEGEAPAQPLKRSKGVHEVIGLVDDIVYSVPERSSW